MLTGTSCKKIKSRCKRRAQIICMYGKEGARGHGREREGGNMQEGSLSGRTIGRKL